MKLIILIFLLALSSCSSTTEAKNWSSWKRCGVEQREMRWDFCKENLHGEKYAKRGFCYASQECRTRRTMWPFRNLRTEKRTAMIFCPFPKGADDHEGWACLNKENIDNKVIMTEP